MRTEQTAAPVSGTVIEFDSDTGLGLVAAQPNSGGEPADPVRFHCVSILDGSRLVEVGQTVRYRLALRLGRLEALGLEVVTPDPGDRG